jgi:hypothetical protein
MAASALVAIPPHAATRAPSHARVFEPARFTAVSMALPAGGTATSTPRPDIATGSAGRLEPGSTLHEPGAPALPGRPTVTQPQPAPRAVARNRWRFDPDISWFGPGFYGSGTACGQVYTRTLMGVAHRSLPCGTLVTFRNPANGRQATVPVIDRGPYVAGRTWDMSRGLCEYLDHCHTGSIQWRWGPPGRG